jgi:hypothetical protein
LVDLEECAVRLGCDGLEDGFKVLEELVDVGGVDCEGEVDADTWIRRHRANIQTFGSFEDFKAILERKAVACNMIAEDLLSL